MGLGAELKQCGWQRGIQEQTRNRALVITLGTVAIAAPLCVCVCVCVFVCARVLCASGPHELGDIKDSQISSAFTSPVWLCCSGDIYLRL